MRLFWTFFSAVYLATVLGPGVAAANPLEGSEWGLPPAQGKATPFVTFRGDGKIGGHAGCNRFFGSFTAAASGTSVAVGTLTVGRLASTRKLCRGDTMQTERGFLKALESVARYQRSPGKLELRNAAGHVVLSLQHRDPD